MTDHMKLNPKGPNITAPSLGVAGGAKGVDVKPQEKVPDVPSELEPSVRLQKPGV